MDASIAPQRDRSWLLALGTLSLGVSVAIGRYHGNAIDFIAGFFLGLSLAVCAYVLVAVLVGRRKS